MGTWVPMKSPSGADQWWTENRGSKYAQTRRLTADLALVTDETYKAIALEYARDHAKFDSDFADAWYKLNHRSEDHPHEDDLEKEVDMCTYFEFLDDAVQDGEVQSLAASQYASKSGPTCRIRCCGLS